MGESVGPFGTLLGDRWREAKSRSQRKQFGIEIVVKGSFNVSLHFNARINIQNRILWHS